MQALSKASSPPAAIIMDIVMPKMDGFDLLQNIRKDTRYEHVPIIILTNSFAEKEEQRFIDAGADLYMVKMKEKTKDVVQKTSELIQKGRIITQKV